MALWETRQTQFVPGVPGFIAVCRAARSIGLIVLCLATLSVPVAAADTSSSVSPAMISAQGQMEEIPGPAPDEQAVVKILARFKPEFITNEANRSMALDRLATLGLRLEREYPLVPGLVRLETATMTDRSDPSPLTLEQQIKALRESGMFQYVEPDTTVQATIKPDCNTFTDGEYSEGR